MIVYLTKSQKSCKKIKSFKLWLKDILNSFQKQMEYSKFYSVKILLLNRILISIGNKSIQVI